MSTLVISGSGIADCRVLAVDGEPGLGFYLLKFRVELQARETGRLASLTMFGGTARLEPRGIPPRRIGNLTLVQPRVPPIDVSRTRTVDLELVLDPHRLQALEDARCGGRFTFALDLYGTGTLDEKPSEIQAIYLRHDVNESVWNDVLEQLDYRKAMLLEIPLLDETTPAYADANEAIAQAAKHLRVGNWRDAVGSCRDVMEGLASALGDNDNADPDINREFGAYKDWDKNKRVRMVRKALRVLTHPAKHAEASARIDWQRDDALAAVAIAGALMRLAREEP